MQFFLTILRASVATPAFTLFTAASVVGLVISTLNLVRTVRLPDRPHRPVGKRSGVLTLIAAWGGVGLTFAFWLIPPVDKGWIVSAVVGAAAAGIDTIWVALSLRRGQTTSAKS